MDETTNKFSRTFARLFKDSKLTQRQMADILGVSQANISKYTKGSMPNLRENEDILQRMCDYFHVTSDELFGINTHDPKHPLLAAKSLPLLGKVSAGLGAYTGNFTTDRYNVPATWLKGDAGDYYVLKVTGDSMCPRIPDGAYALIRKQQDVESGELGIAVIDGEDGVIKKVNKHKDSIELVSFNLNYPPRIFEKEDMNRVKIVGLLKKVIVDF